MYQKPRDAEQYGEGLFLSIQASRFNYCTPRIDALQLHEYEDVEVAMWGQGEPNDSIKSTRWLKPADLRIPDFDDWGAVERPCTCEDRDEDSAYCSTCNGDSVMAYVPIATAMSMRAALIERFGQPHEINEEYATAAKHHS